jgi:hypothetical protein
MKREDPPKVNCPACGVLLHPESDGSIGKHWVGEHAWDMKPCDGIVKPKKPEGKAA